jgi:hypothetical protein
MPVRIERISVLRNGPLKEDFLMEPRGLNLLYGANETGKTMIVESILSFLFKAGPRSTWKGLREWSSSGAVRVSGIGGETLEYTKKPKPKLEDSWLDPVAIPQDLSRLLVIRAGDSRLSDDDQGGVGQAVMKSFLSGERLLDRMEKGISAHLRNASITDGTIAGRHEGDLKRRDELASELDGLQKLIGNVDVDIDQGAVHDLNTRIRQLTSELADLQAGKRHQAILLDGRLRELRSTVESLPDPEELASAEGDARAFLDKTGELERRRKEYEDLAHASEDYFWTRNAAEEYTRAASSGGNGRRKPFTAVLTVLFLAGAIAAGLLDIGLLAVGLGSASVALLLFDYLGSRPASGNAAVEAELAAIRKGYQERFGVPLESLTDLRARTDDLLHRHTQAGLVQRGILELEAEVSAIGSRVRAFFRECGEHCGGTAAWQGGLAEIRVKRTDLERQAILLDRELAGLGVSPADFLPKAPETKWEPAQEERCRRALEQANADLRRLNGSLTQLKVDVAALVHLDAATPWEELRSALADLHSTKAAEYRQLTASILASICVMKVVNEFKGQERARVEQGLASPEITAPVLRLTGRYGSLSLGKEWDLVLTGADHEELPLNMLSSGALEQVHIALRTGFARLALDDTAFLILDDAFQHSDWRRRHFLIDYTADLVREGWQVFYFTMDDHIRGLFEEAGAKLGADYLQVRLD